MADRNGRTALRLASAQSTIPPYSTVLMKYKKEGYFSQPRERKYRKGAMALATIITSASG